ncbi:mucin-5AC-like [Branchiostoma floridae]|uniref:Mucin-5AC-like n=1 Tax=Branchiostoma floridae TaxID=7739 RepID=A0A9J7N3M2_BRAFL|nr:mucin-5AC-like [Branchiostoma floridae]
MDSFVAVCTLLLIVQHLPPGECTTWLCDFETSDLCGHTQDPTDDLDWTRHAGGTPTPNTGPSVDHTLGTGHYMYLETSTGSPGEVARLVSAQFPASSAPYCLRFYYHMFGSSIATLNVYIRKQGILGTPVWTLSGNQGNAWTLGRAQLDGSSSFNVIFEAVRGDSFRGDIAIDDVTVSNECEPIVTTVLPTTTPYPLASPSCTFELSSICGYRQDIHDSAEWTWHQGHTGTSDTGPGFDQTLGTAIGHYMYFEASSIDPGVTARLLSPTLPIIPSPSSHTSYCVTFWYHMYGIHIGTLNVNRKERGGTEAPIWSLSDDQGNVWRQGQLPLDGTSESTVVFEAVRGSSYRGDIAIDDVDVSQYGGQCEFIPASAMVPLPSTPSTTTQSSSTSANPSTSATLPAAEQSSTTMSPEASSAIVTVATSSTTGIISIPATVPSTSTTTTQSRSIGSYHPTSETLPAVTTEEQSSTATATETPSEAATIGTRPSSTTDRPTTLETGSSTNGVKTTAARTSTTMSTEASTVVSIGTQRPSSTIDRLTTLQTVSSTNGVKTTAARSSTTTSTEASSTAATIGTRPSSTTDRPTTSETGSSTNGVKTTAARSSTIMSTEALSTADTIGTRPFSTTDRPTTSSLLTGASTNGVKATAARTPTTTSTEASSTVVTIGTRPSSTTDRPTTSTNGVTTTAARTSTTMSTEASLAIITIGTQRPSLTTDKATTLMTDSSTNGAKTTATRTFTTTSTETSSAITTIGTRPSPTTDRLTTLETVSFTNGVKNTAARTSTTMSTEASSTITTIGTRPSSTTDRRTTLETVSSRNGVTTSTEASSTIITILTGQSWTSGRSRPSPTIVATDSPPPVAKTERTTTKSVRPMKTSSTQSSRITGIGATAGNLSAGQTNNSGMTSTIALAVALSLVCGVAAGVVATMCYKKRKRSRSGHAKVKYVTEENNSASAADSFASVVNGKIVFENPTFEHIYEELPNVVVNSTASREEQEALSGIPSSEAEVYAAIDDDEVCGAKASTQKPVPTTKGDGHISSSARAKGLFSSPGQVDQTERRYGWEAESEDYTEINDDDVLGAKASSLQPAPTSKENGHTRGYQRGSWVGENEVYMEIKDDEVCWTKSKVSSQHPMATSMNGGHISFSDWEAESDYLPPISDPTGHGLNLNDMASNDEGRQPGLNPSAHYQSLRPDHYQSLLHSHYQNSNIHEHAQNPDGYQSLRNIHYQKLNGPTSSQDDPPPSDIKS